MPRKLRCTFVEPIWNERCPNPGKGRPALCDEHLDEDDSPDAVDALLTSVLDHPSIQGILGKVGSVLDKAANLIDKSPGRSAQPITRPPTQEDPYIVLGFDRSQTLTVDMVKERRKALAALVHPDHGGSTTAMARINRAADILLAHL